MPITANPPPENTDPWFAARQAFDLQVKETANDAESAAESAATAAASAQGTADAAAAEVDALAISLGEVASDVSDLSGAVTAAQADADAANAALPAKADLVGGVIPTSQIPAIAITEFLGSVASQAAMLALTGQKGDWAVRTDTSTTWIITGNTPSNISSWTEIDYPAAPVTTVNGQAGTVVLAAGDVGAVPTSRTVAGKSLSANVALVVGDITGAAPLASPAFTGTPTVPDADPELGGDQIANMDTVLAGRAALVAALTAGLAGVDKRIYYDPVDGWPSLASQGPAWMLAVMHIIWDSIGHGTGVITPPDMADDQDWDRDREPA